MPRVDHWEDELDDWEDEPVRIRRPKNDQKAKEHRREENELRRIQRRDRRRYDERA